MEETMKNTYLSIIILTVVISFEIFATPSLGTSFIASYPEIRNSQLNSCTTCHMPVVKDFLNSYGLDLKDKKMVFRDVELIDSDGDGTDNLSEINDFKFPGSYAEYPEYYIFKNKKGDVHFNHEMHVAEESYLSNGDCNNCHGVNKFKRVFNDNISVRVESHRICWKCHKESGSEHAPKKCNGCHE